MSLLNRLLVQGLRIDREVVVLRSDLNLARLVIHDRVIPAVMPKLQLVGLASQRQPEDLVSKADPEHRSLALQLLHVLNRVVERLRITRPIREEDAVRL